MTSEKCELIKQPFLFIVAGPTGSGKSGLVQKISTYKELGYTSEQIKRCFVHVVIDDLVENSKGYKREINDIIKTNCTQFNSTDLHGCEALDEKIETLDDGFLKKFSDAYFNSRKNLDCSDGFTLSDVPNGKNCDTVNDDKFKKGLEMGKNIIFETTGEYYPAWILSIYKKQLANYKIVMAWSFTNIGELMKRNKGRATNDMDLYIKSKGEGSAPRLPDVREKNYVPKVKQIKNTFEKMMKECVNSSLDSELLKTDVKTKQFGEIAYSLFDKFLRCAVQFLVFDNTTRENGKQTIIFDSLDPKNNDISKIDELLAFKGGGFKRRTYSKKRQTRKTKNKKGKRKTKNKKGKRKKSRKKRKNP